MDNGNYINNIRTILRLKLEKFLLYGLVMDHCPQLGENVIIYGAGEIGKLLFRCFDRKPVCFIDRKEGMYDICGVPVYGLEAGTFEKISGDCTVIVTPVWDCDAIRGEIEQFKPDITVISLEKLVEKL